MRLHVFLCLPETDDSVLNVAVNDNFFGELIEVVNLCKDENFKIFYSSENIEYFFDQFKQFNDDIYLTNYRQRLRLLLAKDSVELEFSKKYQPDCQYYIWDFEASCVLPANFLLIELAEYYFQFKNQQYLLVNLGCSTFAGKNTLPIFKDSAKHAHLPDKFVHVHCVTNRDAFTDWLDKFYSKKFTLDNNKDFEPADGELKKGRQGQSVFRHLDTGQYWYLDNKHNDHYEVFDKKGKHIATASLQGKLDEAKAVPGRKLFDS